MKALLMAVSLVLAATPVLADDNEDFLKLVNDSKARCLRNQVCLRDVRQVILDREAAITTCNKRQTPTCPELKDFTDKLDPLRSAGLK